jgi:hypothetical protein
VSGYFAVVADSVAGGAERPHTMPYTLEISDELKGRLDSHLAEDESYEEFIAELVSMYETEGAFLREGYSE